MKRKIVIFGNHLPENMILEKTKKVRQQLEKERLSGLQTTTYVSDSSRCYKHADLVNEQLYGDNLHRANGLVHSKLRPPELLAETIQNEKNQHRIVVLVVNYSVDGLTELLKKLGADQCILDLAQTINLEEDIAYFDQKNNSLQVF